MQCCGTVFSAGRFRFPRRISKLKTDALPMRSSDTVPTFIEDRVSPFLTWEACIMLVADAALRGDSL
jgi:hypothetical protein